MSSAVKVLVAVLVVGAVLWLANVPGWLVLLAVVGIPVVGYLMLDPAQRGRVRAASRRQIGR